MKNQNAFQTIFEPCCLATTIGSLPHTDVGRGTSLMFENTPEIPSWIQFPKRNPYENMMIQFTEGLPGTDFGFLFLMILPAYQGTLPPGSF